MTARRSNPTLRQAEGFVLITALIFLVVLTLVAVTAMKGTGLELRMSTNNAQHTEAFESSESPRVMISRLIEVLGFNAATGWPMSIGGATPDGQFAYTIPPGITIYNAGSTTATGTPSNWFVDIPESGFVYNDFSRVASYTNNVSATGSAYQMKADIDVQRIRTARKVGCELRGGGYETTVCLDFYFYVTSRGTDPTDASNYETSSVYRFVPTN